VRARERRRTSGSTAGGRRPPRWWLRRGGAALLVLSALYLAALLHPQVYFAWARDGASIQVRSDQPIPEGAAVVISLAEARIRRSTLFDAARTYPVYVCNARWRWNHFSGFDGRSRGFQTPLGRAVFLRPARWDTNQLAGPDGRDGPRSLDVYIAHEVTHMMVADRVGLVEGRRLPGWLREGYAEYVARRDTFDFAAARAHLMAGDDGFAAHDPYWRYLLLVAQLLDREGMDLGAVLDAPPDPGEVEARVRAGTSTR
jgi:hypothetical protein